MRIVTAALALGLGFTSVPAFASGVEACSQDSLTSEKIAEIAPTKRVEILNAVGDVVGAFVFATDLPSEELEALYLCGNNPNYYYVEAKLSDWAREQNKAMEIGNIYNDEYEVKATASSMINNETLLRLRMVFEVKFGGVAQDADYPPFKAQVFVNFPR